jgi:hypothetical protein
VDGPRGRAEVGRLRATAAGYLPTLPSRCAWAAFSPMAKFISLLSIALLCSACSVCSHRRLSNRLATMKITNSAVPVYTISGSEARPLPEWLIRRRKRYAAACDTTNTSTNTCAGV